MLRRALPFANLVRRRLRGARASLDDVAHAREVLQPEEVETVSPPILLPGMLERATATGTPASLEQELRVATRREARHAPVIRWSLGPGLALLDGWAVSGLNTKYGPDFVRDALSAPLREVGPMHVCTTHVSRLYFGHWLRDSTAQACLTREDEALWLPYPQSWGHCPEYLRLFSLSPVEARAAWTSDLTVCQDYGQGSLKQARYRELRARLRAAVAPQEGSRLVYLRRGAAGVARMIADEERLVEALAARGFRIVDTASVPAAEILAAVMDAEVVISIDGSHVNHAHKAMAEGGVLLVLTPADRFTMIHPAIAVAHGLTPAAVVIEPSPEGYRVNLDEVFATLDLAQRTG